MRLPTLTGEFRLANDPELRFTPAGKAVTNVTLVASESKKNENTGEWEDGDRTPFITASVWNQGQGTQAEDVAEAFVKGQRVLVTGQLYAREYDRNDGTKGQSIELKWATIAAVPNGLPRGQGGGQQAPQQRQQQGQGRQQGGGYNTRPAAKRDVDPWATPGASDEPPF